MNEKQPLSFSSRQSVLFEKWRKLQSRIQHKLDNGSFYQLSRARQSQLLKRLRRYYQQLQRLGISLKRVAIGGALALSLALAAPTQAQTFVERTGSENPFNGVDVGYDSSPTLVDIDNDGDLDAFIGEFLGKIKYYENGGSSTNPIFIEQTGADNPLGGVNVIYEARPAIIDLDDDGDLDAVVGMAFGAVHYFENTGTSSNPAFTEQTGPNNPVAGMNIGGVPDPALVDIDDDGDLDAFIGQFNGLIAYFENTGTASDPTFIQAGPDNPFPMDTLSSASPELVDIDDDGDFDAFVGEDPGTIRYYKNTGSSTSPVLVEQTGMDNPFNGLNVGVAAKPCLVDLDDDGDLDAIIGDAFGVIRYFENTQITSTSSLSKQASIGALYPNPNRDGLVHLDYTAIRSEDLVLRIVDVAGKRVSTQIHGVVEGPQTLNLDVSGLNRGIYFIEIGESAKKIQHKLVIE